MNKNQFCLVAVLIALLPLTSSAQNYTPVSTGFAKIGQVVVYKSNTTGFVSISSAHTTVTNCGTPFGSYLLDTTTANGKEMFSLLMAAKLAGKEVFFHLTGVCTSQPWGGSFPMIDAIGVQ